MWSNWLTPSKTLDGFFAFPSITLYNPIFLKNVHCIFIVSNSGKIESLVSAPPPPRSIKKQNGNETKKLKKNKMKNKPYSLKMSSAHLLPILLNHKIWSNQTEGKHLYFMVGRELISFHWPWACQWLWGEAAWRPNCQMERSFLSGL